LNLSMKGHANCVRFVKSFGKPLLLLGGGGYTMRNVSRCWAYETGLAAGVELGEDIPINEYYEYFGPYYKLDVKQSNMEDMNTREYLERMKGKVLENLRYIRGPPSVQMQSVPRVPVLDDQDENEDEDMVDPDDRRPQQARDKQVQHDQDLSDSEDEGTGGRRDRQDRKKKPSIMDGGRHPDTKDDEEILATSTLLAPMGPVPPPVPAPGAAIVSAERPVATSGALGIVTAASSTLEPNGSKMEVDEK